MDRSLSALCITDHGQRIALIIQRARLINLKGKPTVKGQTTIEAINGIAVIAMIAFKKAKFVMGKGQRTG